MQTTCFYWRDIGPTLLISMLNNLTQRLSKVVKTMRGEARLTEANTADMLREVRLALLEADVALPAVRDFIARFPSTWAVNDGVGATAKGLTSYIKLLSC